MNDTRKSDAQTPAEEFALARLLFGWTFQRGANLICLAAFALFGAAMVAAEYARPRTGLRLPFEDQQGFYAAIGAGAVAAALLIGAALRWLIVREAPYPIDAMDEEGRDDDHA